MIYRMHRGDLKKNDQIRNLSVIGDTQAYCRSLHWLCYTSDVIF